MASLCLTPWVAAFCLGVTDRFQPKAMCMAKCKTPPIHNCTPPVLQGTYRGIKISGDGTPHGEWDLKLGPCYAELKNSTGEHMTLYKKC